MLQLLRNAVSEYESCNGHQYGDWTVSEYTFETKDEPLAVMYDDERGSGAFGLGRIHVHEILKRTCKHDDCTHSETKQRVAGTISLTNLLDVADVDYDEDRVNIFA